MAHRVADDEDPVREVRAVERARVPLDRTHRPEWAGVQPIRESGAGCSRRTYTHLQHANR